MNTYFDMSLAYDNDIYKDYVCRDVGEHIYIKGEEYVILRVDWAGYYDYNVEMCPVALLGQFKN